jgi:hypothetical protein
MRPATLLMCFVLVACSSKPLFGPGSAILYGNPTILVTNAACTVGSCQNPFALSESFVGSTCEGLTSPCGDYSYGEFSTPSKCLVLIYSVPIGPGVSQGTTADSIILFAQYVGASAYGTSPFVPQDAPGWTLTFDPLSNAPPSITAMSKACTPPFDDSP